MTWNGGLNMQPDLKCGFIGHEYANIHAQGTFVLDAIPSYISTGALEFVNGVTSSPCHFIG
jgi:hypothetical protein